MKLLVLPALFCAISIQLFSQKNLKDGIIVTVNGDSLRGYIDYKEWYRNPNNVLFTESKAVAVKRYNLEEVDFFSVLNEESYKKYTVNITMDKLVMGALGDKDTSSRNETVFLKILQQGKNLALFSFTDAVKQRFYILQLGESTPVELKNSAYMLNGQVVEERQYRAILSSLASKYIPSDSRIGASIRSADYSSKTIRSICSRLNDLRPGEAAQQGGANRSRFRPYVFAGINHGTLEFTGTNHYTGNDSGPAYFPVLGIGVDIFANPATKKLFLKNQLAFTLFKTDADAVVKYYEATENYSLKFRQTNISLHSQLCYNIYRQQSLNWYIGAGAGMNLSFYPSNQETLVKQGLSGAAVTTVDEEYISYIKRFWLSAAFRTGITIKKIDCSIAYFPQSSITKHTGFDLKNSSLQLQAAILLGK